MATTTVNLFTSKSASQAADYSFGMTLSDVATAINNALPANAVISSIKLQFQCSASVKTNYANVKTYVSLTSSDSNANSSSKSTQLISLSYKTTDGTQTPSDVDVTTYFNSYEPYSVQNTSYSRISVYFDTTNITTKTFNCIYLRLYITYEVAGCIATFTNYNGNVLKTESVSYGGTPTPPSNPSRPADEYYTYTFTGWSPAIGAIYANTTYTAQYQSVVRKYQISASVTPSATNATITGTGSYKYGDTVTLSATPHNGCSFYAFIDTSIHDGFLYNPYSFTVTGNRNFQVYCPKDSAQFNKIIIGNSMPSKIYIDNSEVKEVYIDSVKVYEKAKPSFATITSANLLYSAIPSYIYASNWTQAWNGLFDKNWDEWNNFGGGSGTIYTASTLLFNDLPQNAKITGFEVKVKCKENGTQNYSVSHFFNLCHDITSDGGYIDCGDGKQGFSYGNADGAYKDIERYFVYTEKDMPNTLTWLQNNINSVLNGNFGVYMETYRMYLYEWDMTIFYE